MRIHPLTDWILLVSAALLTAWRAFIYAKSEQRIGWSYLVPAFLVLALTFFQGWFGGEMVYSQGAGVVTAGKGTEPVSAGENRMEAVTDAMGWRHAQGGEQGISGQPDDKH